MGTTFVTLSTETSGREPGFWMRDGLLELWLRLLALHLPEPSDDGQHEATLLIRNQWLLASRGWFNGFVPHGMEEACATTQGMIVVRVAIKSLLSALQQVETPLQPATLNLLGIDCEFTEPIERGQLIDVGYAFLDLLDGKISDTPSSTEIIPGSKPYRRM